MATNVSIPVREDLRDRLRAAKRGGESYTDVIERYFDPSEEMLKYGGYEPEDVDE